MGSAVRTKAMRRGEGGLREARPGRRGRRRHRHRHRGQPGPEEPEGPTEREDEIFEDWLRAIHDILEAGQKRDGPRKPESGEPALTDNGLEDMMWKIWVEERDKQYHYAEQRMAQLEAKKSPLERAGEGGMMKSQKFAWSRCPCRCRHT